MLLALLIQLTVSARQQPTRSANSQLVFNISSRKLSLASRCRPSSTRPTTLGESL